MTAVGLSERVARLEADRDHLATKGDLYRALLLMTVGQTTINAAMLAIVVRVLS